MLADEPITPFSFELDSLINNDCNLKSALDLYCKVFENTFKEITNISTHNNCAKSYINLLALNINNNKLLLSFYESIKQIDPKHCHYDNITLNWDKLKRQWDNTHIKNIDDLVTQIKQNNIAKMVLSYLSCKFRV